MFQFPGPLVYPRHSPPKTILETPLCSWKDGRVAPDSASRDSVMQTPEKQLSRPKRQIGTCHDLFWLGGGKTHQNTSKQRFLLLILNFDAILNSSTQLQMKMDPENHRVTIERLLPGVFFKVDFSLQGVDSIQQSNQKSP